MTRAAALRRAGLGVIGIGVDLCDIRRIEKSMERFGDKFLDRHFTADERRFCDARQATRAAAYAKRWAAKEACAKALGTGVASGVALRDIEVETQSSGAPRLRLQGGAARRIAEMTPDGAESRVHLSLSDELPYAQAFVVIEAALPRG